MKGKITGRNAVLETLKFGTKFKALYINRAAKGSKVKEIIRMAEKQRVRHEFVNLKRLNKLSDDRHHQGVVGIVEREEREFDDVLEMVYKEKGGVILIIREIMYEQNLGAILRTAEAAGVDAVVMTNRQKHGHSEVVSRVSMGASERLLVVETNMFDGIKRLKQAGCTVVGVEVGGKMPYYDVPTRGWTAYLLGGEDQGLSKNLLDRCDLTVDVPMKGKVTSLNVGVTTAVVLFDHLRRENQQKRQIKKQNKTK